MLFLIIVSPLVQTAFFCLGYAREIEDIKIYVTDLDVTPPGNKYLLLSVCVRVRAYSSTVYRDHEG